MIIKGSFVNEKGDVVGVTITLTATGTDLEIEPDGELEFAADDTWLSSTDAPSTCTLEATWAICSRASTRTARWR